ncbi:Anucleate primary sterigmata A [Lecanosticta acicola]|uniref:Anucleate primary sterigmata A n=1 Tax=Lecanosticta acicola TaxID=111012 RepID=A0AAI8YUZ2_9PEZI|nr:Anucleate primary sterigmata A [Lecanosticta acicola]
MADYFSEYSSFAGAKRLPSPADTPYETPGFIRSKRSSRVASSSREQSTSPPPLPPDTSEYQEKTRDGRYTAVDPRRFTPTLHASLVSEILNLRRELDSKNNLVENLETSLSSAKTENETLNEQLSDRAKEVRKAKQHVQQMERGVYDAVEDVVRERDEAKASLEDLKNKFEIAQKKTRQQDEDALRTHSIWENEKESWDNERRQLERRVHVTESRLRAVVDEMAAQQSQMAQADEHSDEATFKDSGLGEGSDTASIRSATVTTPVKHRRNMSSISFRPRNARTSVSSRMTAATPDLYARPGGNTLADELDIDEEEEYDDEEFEHVDEDAQSPQRRKHVDYRQNSMTVEVAAPAKPIIALTSDALQSANEMRRLSPERRRLQYQDRATTPPPALAIAEPTPRAVYVDKGYQPSPPPSPPRVHITDEQQRTVITTGDSSGDSVRLAEIQTETSPHQPTPGLRSSIGSSPISPPQTPVVDDEPAWLDEKSASVVAPTYSTAATQTDSVEPARPRGHPPKRDSLSPPSFVPAIAIHPPGSRPSSPRPYALPPGTKNASTQARLGWPCKDASVQTEEIRIDRRPVKLPPHLLPCNLLPSPTFQEPMRFKRVPTEGSAKIFTKLPSALSSPASPPLQSPTDSSPEMSRSNGSKDLRSYPLKALPLPRPVLSPPGPPQGETFQSNGPLNRSSQYGVSQSKLESHVTDIDQWSEPSDYEGPTSPDLDSADLTGSIPALSRPPPGRFNLSEPPKAVPEDKEISPERRPDTADSYGAAPEPSVASSRATSQRRSVRQPAKLGKPDARKDMHSRNSSFGSMASSSYSTQSNLPMPPFPIPLRSSSRITGKPHSEGSGSPSRSVQSRSQQQRQANLRKVQSAAAIRNRNGRVSPQKHRRRRRSPDLTPVQSMAFESPTPTKFPIPELPTPLQDNLAFDYVKGSVDLSRSPGEASSVARVSEETNLVDAIAATMVGEWMWKYIRKRKSFGIGEDNSEFPVADQNGVVNLATGHGTRHKRWVWLSPYERTIMWDTKQPNSGAALLGKKGRKLTIQSVLDVEDLTPLPKNAELYTAWKRSILILTPERALKFTAINEERHALWMTALSFLSQSAQLPTQIPRPPPSKVHAPPIPPVPAIPSTSIDGVPIKRHRSPSFGRSTVRDSIRLAKGKRPELHKVQSQPDQPYGSDLPGVEGNDSADFPAVPRLYISTTRHQRKRSDTQPGMSQSLANFRSFSSSAVPSSASSALRHGASTDGSSYRPSVSTKYGGSTRGSIASPDRPNFFEAVGTVRMEAFVDPNVRDGVLYVPAPPPPAIGASRRPRRGSGLSQSTVDKRRAGYVFDEDGMDPFKGF